MSKETTTEDLDQFLDALDKEVVPAKKDPPPASSSLESPYMSSSPTRNERKSINKEIPKAAVGKELISKSHKKTKMLDRSNKIPLRRSPAKTPISTPAVSPKALTAPIPTRGGLTMYERSMLAMEERDRKLQVLKEKLQEECTFTPNSKRSNGSRSVDGSSPRTSVYTRLYDARKPPTPRRTDRGASVAGSPPSISRSRSVDSARSKHSVTSTRLVEMHERGQELLRQRGMNNRQEEEARRRRLEEEELANCTFTPKTNWNLARERREKAKKAAMSSPAPSLSEKKRRISDRERRQRMMEDLELKHCTFSPQMKWNITKERKAAAENAKDIYHDIVENDFAEAPKGIPMFISASVDTTPAKSNMHPAVSPLAEPSTDSKAQSKQSKHHFDGSAPDKIASSSTTEKLTQKVYSDKDQKEAQGQKTSAASLVRAGMISQVTPSTPEWQEKYRKIGNKNAGEQVIETQGTISTENIQVRGQSTIVAGGNKQDNKTKRLSSGLTPISPQKPTTPTKPKTEEVGGFKVAKRSSKADEVAERKAAQAAEMRAEKERALAEKKESERQRQEELKLKKEADAAAKAETARLRRESVQRKKEEAEAERRRKEEEKGRLAKEREEKLRIEKEEREEKLRIEKERREEKLRIEKEKAEAERLRIEKEKKEKAEAERLRIEKEKKEEAEKLRIEKEKAEAERLRIEKEKIQAEKLRMEKEKAEAERLRIEKEKIQAEKLRMEKEKAEAERLRVEKEKIEKEKAEKLRMEKEKAEAERLRVEKEKIEKEKAEKLRMEKEKAEAEKLRIEQEKAQAARIAMEEKAKAQSISESASADGEDESSKKKSDRAKKWKDRLAKKSGKSGSREPSGEDLELAANSTKPDREEALLLAKIAEEKKRQEEIQNQQASDKSSDEALLLAKIAEEKKRQDEESLLLAKLAEAKKQQEEAERLASAAEEKKKMDEEGKRKKQEEAALLAKIAEEKKRAEEMEIKKREEAALLAKIEKEKKKLQMQEAEQKKDEEAALLAKIAEEKKKAEASEAKAKMKADEAALLAMIEAENKKIEEEANRKAELAKQSDPAPGTKSSTKESKSKSSRAQKWKERLAKKGVSSGESSDDNDDMLVSEGDEAKTSDAKSERAKKWKERLAKKTSKKEEGDVKSDAATTGADDKEAFPRVLYSDGGEDAPKEPEIGSI